MKKCRTCRYGRMYELDKPCVVYRDDCPLYQKVGEYMENKEALSLIESYLKSGYAHNTDDFKQALEIAIKAIENISHITDRPCDVCEFHTEQGCTQWKCVFCDELFGGMRR